MKFFMKVFYPAFLAVLLTGAPSLFAQTAVDTYGQLGINGNEVVDESGQPVQLQGMSLFWSQWSTQHFYSKETAKELRDDWCNNVIRAAMAVDDDGGYLTNPGEENKVRTVVEAAIDLGMYVVIDWHSHHAEDHEAAAIDFFSRMAQDYGDYPNIIYETYNEPLDVSWSNDLKPYHEAVIAAIREHDQNNIIVCGTPNWSQDVDAAASDPITGYDNIAYTLHYYAGSHFSELRAKGDAALNSNLALFVTEYGLVNADGDGGVDEGSSNEWYDWMEQHNISHCNWSANDKNEGSSAFVSGTGPSGWSESNLTASGKFVRDYHVANCPEYSMAEPSITSQPNNQMANEGEEVQFTVEATGGSLNFQWQKDGQDINGATSATYTIPSFSLDDEGTYSVTVSNEMGTVTSDNANLSLLQPGPWGGVAHPVPGRIEAEEYDIGGQDISYYDNTEGNNGNTFRDDDVDIESTQDTEGDYHVGWIEQGEWLTYTIDVAAQGAYDFEFRMASANTDVTLQIELDGVVLIETVNVPNTGDWQTFATEVIQGVDLAEGEHELRVTFEGNGVNFNYLDITGDVTDCNGVENGDAYIDECGECVGGNTGKEPNESCADCNGDPNGDASIDDCGECTGGQTGIEPNSSCADCNGDPNGDAFIDDCGECAGGQTGIEPNSSCTDCDGVVNGDAFIDDCGECAGGETGVEPNESCADCNGDPNGDAVIDDCGECAGGETGIEPNSSCGIPSIISSPSDMMIAENDSVGLTVEASGPGELTYQWYLNDNMIQGATDTSYIIENFSEADEGIYIIEVSNENGAVSDTFELSLPRQEPYNGTPQVIPGVIQAQDYDLGGQGLAYNDSEDWNQGEVYRTNENVDLEATEDETGGDYHVGWTADGEWIEYTVNVEEEGYYNISARVSSDIGSGLFSILMDGDTIASGMEVENTEGWQSFKTTEYSEPVYLTSGEKVLHLGILIGEFNINYLEFVKASVDCNGDVEGEAYIDSCGTCAGGETGIEPVTNPDDCVTSVFEKENSEFADVYPNPVTDRLTIELKTEGEYHVKVYDANGKMVRNEMIQQSGNDLQLSGLPSGVYQVVINGDHNSQTWSILKQ